MNWKQKLSSRKFWMALSGLVVAVMTAFNINDLNVQQTATIITAIGVVAAYIFGESWVDTTRGTNDKNGET